MENKFKNMSYDEFFNYCEERACDGRWSLEEAILCLNILEHLWSIKVYTYRIFLSRNKTKKAREDEWNKIKEFIGGK